MDRRAFVKSTAALGGVALTAPLDAAGMMKRMDRFAGESAGRGGSTTSLIAFVKTTDRAAGVRRALDLLDFGSQRGKDLFLKPNFNSHHDTPGSTHNETLTALARALRARGAARITIGDRSGMGDTRGVMERKDIFRMAEELAFETIVFDELDETGWELMRRDDSHWRAGFALPRPVLDADGVIQTCCLKTHQFGGHFTMALKNSVGLVAKRLPGETHDYMRELHGSPDQRKMIAEINAAYRPDVIVLDGVEAFVDGGPHAGTRVTAEVVLAGTDPIAIDAVGVALLRHYGTTPEVSRGRIFEQDQIARAVELGVGTGAPDQIELVTGDPESRAYAQRIGEVLRA